MLNACKCLLPGKKIKKSHVPILNETLVLRVGLHPVTLSGNMTDLMPRREVTTEPTV